MSLTIEPDDLLGASARQWGSVSEQNDNCMQFSAANEFCRSAVGAMKREVSQKRGHTKPWWQLQGC